jgi:hypothetical protein
MVLVVVVVLEQLVKMGHLQQVVLVELVGLEQQVQLMEHRQQELAVVAVVLFQVEDLVVLVVQE